MLYFVGIRSLSRYHNGYNVYYIGFLTDSRIPARTSAKPNAEGSGIAALARSSSGVFGCWVG